MKPNPDVIFGTEGPLTAARAGYILMMRLKQSSIVLDDEEQAACDLFSNLARGIPQESDLLTSLKELLPLAELQVASNKKALGALYSSAVARIAKGRIAIAKAEGKIT